MEDNEEKEDDGNHPMFPEYCDTATREAEDQEHGFGYHPRKTDTGRLPRFSPPHEKYLSRAKNTEIFE